MKTFIVFLLIIGFFSSNPKHLIQNNAETEVSFKVKNLGISVEGEFTDLIIESNFNIDDLTNSYIKATIKVNSLDTGNKKRDKDLMKAKYFDVDNFEEINFTSTKIEKLQENNYNLTGNLTIKNTTKLITIPFEFDDKNLMIQSDFELNRRDYKVGGKSWAMSDQIKIKVLYSINN
jgi:polyisoprenoid-binding protein YceI